MTTKYGQRAKDIISIGSLQRTGHGEGLEPRADVGINVGTNVGINEQRTLDLIRINNRITAKEIAESLSVSLRQGERIMATLKEKGFIKRIGSNKSGHWEIIT